MTTRISTIAVSCLWAVLVSACGDPKVADAPPPQEPTREATGYYCSMTVVDHPGPKGQIYLEGENHPLWFSSVRDTIAFTMLPEESKDITAIYVNDMARSKTWKQPEPNTWIRADEAWYVIGSTRRGGMGAPEAVPFGDRDKAQYFADEYGGRAVAFKDIPHEVILGNAADSSNQQADRSPPDVGHGTAELKHEEHRP